MENTRESAMKWWHKLSFEEKFYKVIAWLKSQKRDTTERHPDSLTSREIEEIHKSEAITDNSK